MIEEEEKFFSYQGEKSRIIRDMKIFALGEDQDPIRIIGAELVDNKFRIFIVLPDKIYKKDFNTELDMINDFEQTYDSIDDIAKNF